MEYLSLSLLRILDNAISAAKSIATYKEKAILSSLLVESSALIKLSISSALTSSG